MTKRERIARAVCVVILATLLPILFIIYTK